jgi:hypothetical protein
MKALNHAIKRLINLKKKLLFIILWTVFLVSFVPRSRGEHGCVFDYYFANSKKNWSDQKDFGKWTEKNDTAVITLGYFRGDCCGGVPNPKRMVAEILHDTLYFDYRTSKDPNCDSSIGLCGATIDFVINAKRYPDYKHLVFHNRFINGKNKFIGNTYQAKIREACKEMIDGGCMLYTFCVLKFEKDSVQVSYRAKANCTPKEREKNYEHIYDNLTKIYKWTLDNDVITIDNFGDYGALTARDSNLFGTRGIEFVKEDK